MLLRKIVFAQILFISINSFASNFGSDGRNGADGARGRDGGRGQDVTVQATGQTLNLNLSGRDAEDGRDGYDGEDAYNCAQPRRVEYNLTGANGGNGGTAGQGGTGGSGGNIIVYTNNINNLKNVTVYSEGGRGGRSGRAGNFGRGCRCSEPQWRVRHCTRDDKGREICRENTYYCNDGQTGRSGEQKNNGSAGNRGRLTLIPTLEQVPGENKYAEIEVSSITSAKINLVAQVWQQLGGAASLFAAGSVVRDDYMKFMGMRGFTYGFSWSARRAYTDFSGAKMILRATQEGVNSYGSNGFWYDSTIQRSGDNYSENVTRAMWGVEAEKLSLEFASQQRGFVAKITDQANVNDMLKTGFVNVVFKKHRPIIWDKTLFEGNIPASHIYENGGLILIKLGELPDVDPSDLEDGNSITLKMQATRVFSNDYSARVSFDVKHEIKK